MNIPHLNHNDSNGGLFVLNSLEKLRTEMVTELC